MTNKSTTCFPLRKLTNGDICTVARYDEDFISAAKTMGAKFHRVGGQPVWAIPAALDMDDEFRAIVLAARDRAEAADAAKAEAAAAEAKARWENASQAEKARWYRNSHNEGGEGYNPYA